MDKLHVFSVSELNSIIKNILEEAFPEIWVEGEISNFKNYSNNFFFTLKDEESQIRVVFFRSYMNSLKFMPKDGMKVIIRGKLTIYETRGEYQLVANYIEPLGIGILKIRFEELKKKLEEKGYFDPARKKAIPLLPKKIGIITSPKGAVIRDMLNILRRRFYSLHIIIFPVKVQGEGAAFEIAEAISFANKHFGNFLDVIILARGGGSFEDLFAFNEEVVANAIFHSHIPIISAIGHETDFTIADFTADLRASTPSAAAELVVMKKEELDEKIFNHFVRIKGHILKKIALLKKKIEMEKRSLRMPYLRINQIREKVSFLQAMLEKSIASKFNRLRQKIAIVEKRIHLLSPQKRLAIKKEMLIRFWSELKNRIRNNIKTKNTSFLSITKTLEAISPLKVLSRGYSITLDSDNRVIRTIDHVKIGEDIITILVDGQLISKVFEKKEKK
jgi:exodeoxyribonuclease VII large subunit